MERFLSWLVSRIFTFGSVSRLIALSVPFFSSNFLSTDFVLKNDYDKFSHHASSFKNFAIPGALKLGATIFLIINHYE